MEPSGMHIPEDALLQHEYMTPIGECLFPRSSPTDQPRGLMPACRWLPAPALKLRRGRSPWRPRFPVRDKFVPLFISISFTISYMEPEGIHIHVNINPNLACRQLPLWSMTDS